MEILIIINWNIRSIKGKEHELVEEFEKANLDFLAITETKKKGQGMIKLGKGHALFYKGVTAEQRAAEGVGCLIKNQQVKNIKKCKYI